MLNRIRLLRACQVFLLSGLLLAAGQAMNAQSVGKTPSQAPAAAPSQPPQPASQQSPQATQPVHAPDDTSPKPQTPPEPVFKLADVVQKVESDGRSTSIRDYIAEGVGIRSRQIDSSPVQARSLSDTQRELFVIDDNGALLFLMKNGETTFAYLANHAGMLQTAGYFYPGRFHSQEFKSVSKEKAAAGFAAEGEFWIKRIFPPKNGDAVKPGESASEPDGAGSGAGAREKAELDSKTAREAGSLKTAPTAGAAADVDEKDKLSQMTPKERIKYLDQQMREAKQEAKLEKKLASKTAAHKRQEAKSTEKNPQAAPANSNQQSNTDGDATPPKKKISWF